MGHTEKGGLNFFRSATVRERDEPYLVSLGVLFATASFHDQPGCCFRLRSNVERLVLLEEYSREESVEHALRYV